MIHQNDIGVVFLFSFFFFPSMVLPVAFINKCIHFKLRIKSSLQFNLSQPTRLKIKRHWLMSTIIYSRTISKNLRPHCLPTSCVSQVHFYREPTVTDLQYFQRVEKVKMCPLL